MKPMRKTPQGDEGSPPGFSVVDYPRAGYAVTLDAATLRRLEARAEQVVAEQTGQGAGGARYDVLLPIVRGIRDRVGRSGVTVAVEMLIDEGIFEEAERAAALKAFRRRLVLLNEQADTRRQ